MENNMMENMEPHVNVEAPTGLADVHCIKNVTEREEKMKMKCQLKTIESGECGKEADNKMEMVEPPLVRPLCILYWEKTVKANVNNATSSSKQPIVYTGTAEQGELGKSVGHVDIGLGELAYFFRLSIPGVNPENVKCLVEGNGKITVEAVTETGEWCIGRDHHVFFMKTHNLPPRGDFKVSFQLPGPVDQGSWSGTINRGMLEGVVTKEGY